MEPHSANFTLRDADVKLVERLKKLLEPTHGQLSNVAVVRMGLRALEQQYAKGEKK